MAAQWIERRLERLIWKFRLISIVPMVLSLHGSAGCLVIGAVEVFNAFLVIMRWLSLPRSLQARPSPRCRDGGGGGDCFVIGFALRIFGYSNYELVASGLDPRLEGGEEQKTNISRRTASKDLKRICLM